MDFSILSKIIWMLIFQLILLYLVYKNATLHCLVCAACVDLLAVLIILKLKRYRVAEDKLKIFPILYCQILFLFYIFGIDLIHSLLPSFFLTMYTFVHKYPFHLIICTMFSYFYALDWIDSRLIYPYPTYCGMLLGSQINLLLDVFLEKK